MYNAGYNISIIIASKNRFTILIQNMTEMEKNFFFSISEKPIHVQKGRYLSCCGSSWGGGAHFVCGWWKPNKNGIIIWNWNDKSITKCQQSLYTHERSTIHSRLYIWNIRFVLDLPRFLSRPPKNVAAKQPSLSIYAMCDVAFKFVWNNRNWPAAAPSWFQAPNFAFLRKARLDKPRSNDVKLKCTHIQYCYNGVV